MVISALQPRSIRPFHWLLAVCLALIAHSLMLLQYPDMPIATEEASVEEAIVISLKSMKAMSPLVAATPAIVAPPEITAEKITSKKPASKPVTRRVNKPKLSKQKPVPVEPVVSTPAASENKIESVVEKERHTAKGTNKQIQKSDPVGISGAEFDDIKLQYLTKLSVWLARHKRYPKLARRRKQEGVVKVKFWIDSKGKLLSHQLLDRSAYDSLNREVERMLKRASPMPPIPKALRTNPDQQYSYTIPVRFELKVVN